MKNTSSAVKNSATAMDYKVQWIQSNIATHSRNGSKQS